MPTSEPFGVDGDPQFGRSRKSDGFAEKFQNRGGGLPPPRLGDETLPSVSRFDEATNSKWIPSSAETSRPEPDTINNPTSVPTSPLFQETRYGRANSAGFGTPTFAPANNPGSRFSAAGMTADGLGEAHVAGVLSGIRRQAQAFLGDQISPIRLASHLAVIAVAAVVLIVSQVELPDWQFSLRSLPEDGLFAASQTTSSVTGGDTTSEVAEAFQRAVIPLTNQQTQPMLATAQETVQEAVAPVQAAGPALVSAREQIETYNVRSGDTVLGIAAKFNLQPETIQWANPELEANPDMLRIGDRLVILPTDGVLHVVQSGDTLSTIAAKYKVTTEAIVSFGQNNLADSSTPIAVGQQLVIPGGNKPYIAKQVLAYSGPIPEGASLGTGALVWPTSGSITQPYWNGHRAIDVGAWTGTAITSADSGYVIAARTGWNSGYGTMVMIDHGNGYVTLYAHMNSIFVRQGESVSKGQQLGTVGNTGNSTGPHLHFEVRYQGVPRNPFNFLP